MNPRLFPFLALACTPAYALDLFIAKNGDDAWSGKLAAPNAQKSDGPFASFDRAREEIRNQKPHTAVNVRVRSGIYEFQKTFTLTATDTGTNAAPLEFSTFKGESVTLIGGKRITHFQPYRGEILQADLTGQELNGVHFRQLLFAGKRQPLARYPNEDASHPVAGGWAYVAGKIQPLYQDIPGEDKRTLVFKDSDTRTWAHPEDGEVFIFPRYNWWNDIRQIRSLDLAKHTLTVTQDTSYAMRPGDRYFVRGLFEELDAPGEWYLDTRASKLYFWPPSSIGETPVYVPCVSTIIELDGVSNVTMRGFHIECCEGTAVVLKNTARCTVAANTIRNVGGFHGSAVAVDGRENGVVGNDISEVGDAGIVLNGGDRKTLTAAGNFADNNYIHHVGVFYKQGDGITLNGVGNRASHNLIHDTPRFAIQFRGNNQIIEYNHLRHLALETEDVGATYCGGRDWLTPRGSVIRYNFIHDVIGFGRTEHKDQAEWVSPYFAWGIYLDDNSGGVDVVGNVVARCGRALFHAHSARDSLLENNIFVEGGMRQWEWDGWTTTSSHWQQHFPDMVKGYESVAKELAWQHLRGMKIHPKDSPDDQGRVMRGNVATHNLLVWKKPEAAALNSIAFNASLNTIDHNLYWHFGEPLKTGQHHAGKATTANLAPNPHFEGKPGELPHDWQWQIRPRLDAQAGVAEDGLIIQAARMNEKTKDNYPIIVSREITLKPGATYRFRATLRTDVETAKTQAMVQFYVNPEGPQPAHFWVNPFAEITLTPAWKNFETVFKIPAPGEDGWDARMTQEKFRLRFDWPAATGALHVSETSLEQVGELDEWQSWQALGADTHSIIADPKFLDAAHDDYRLAPDSPALKLGFKPIPVEKIGPYADPSRASWPIVESPGAREHPTTIPVHPS